MKSESHPGLRLRNWSCQLSSLMRRSVRKRVIAARMAASARAESVGPGSSSNCDIIAFNVQRPGLACNCLYAAPTTHTERMSTNVSAAKLSRLASRSFRYAQAGSVDRAIDGLSWLRARRLFQQSGLFAALPLTGCVLEVEGDRGHLAEAAVHHSPNRRCFVVDASCKTRQLSIGGSAAASFIASVLRRIACPSLTARSTPPGPLSPWPGSTRQPRNLSWPRCAASSDPAAY